VTGVASGMSSTSSKTRVGRAGKGRRPPAAADGPRAAPDAAPDAGEARGRRDLPATVAVGRVLRPHGLRGEVVVAVLTDSPRRFDPGSSLLLVREGEPPVEMVVAGRRAAGLNAAADPAAAAAAAPPAAPATRASGGGAVPRARQATALVRFAGVGDREAAVALRGGWLEIERSRVPPAPPGTYYHYELLGCRCASGGEDLGEVVEVVEDGGGLLLVVSDGIRAVPVPFAARFVRAVDVERARIELDLPPGLIETCASRC
jgi:16S rRNA processing protein RimM